MSRFISAIMNSDRAVVGASLAGITVLAWIYLVREAEKMSQMDVGMAMLSMHSIREQAGADDMAQMIAVLQHIYQQG